MVNFQNSLRNDAFPRQSKVRWPDLTGKAYCVDFRRIVQESRGEDWEVKELFLFR